MFKRLILSSFFIVTSLLADYSLLSKEVLPHIPWLNNVVDVRSGIVISNIGHIQGMVILITKELEKKKELTIQLQALSQEDYVVNKETLFLIQKLNNLKEVSVDSRNTTTSGLSSSDDFSLNKFKKDLGKAENIGNSDIYGQDREYEENISKSEKKSLESEQITQGKKNE